MKRITQLTAKRIPDPQISQISTLSSLHSALVRPSRPRKLAESPRLQPQAVKISAPNVSIFRQRRRLEHKETSVGRWKVIVDELERRNLPVRGTNWPDAKMIPPPFYSDGMQRKEKGRARARARA